uniref:Translation initiation factor eIF2B subunit epsilon n=1 Tax=Compsopogon caeruleus TaxID=31354 RepID=A0A6T6C1I5_9RHOD|mmetsp:Transcript_16617/g.34077  ORF Transcript_16617/g.34077 Transcript_16617/m.34077 type:complete len:737 (+) Transcript_16617:98-2308(+)
MGREGPGGGSNKGVSLLKANADEEPLRAILFAHDHGALRAMSDTVGGSPGMPFSAACIPLVNVPVVVYQLVGLARSEVKDCLVLSTVSLDQLREALAAAELVDPIGVSGNHRGSAALAENNEAERTKAFESFHIQGMSVRLMEGSDWRCAGDALREVNSRSGLRPSKDFILISTASIFNFSLSNVLKEHRARRASDKNWLMTSIFRRGNRELAGRAPTTSTRKQLAIAVDSSTRQLVKYTELSPADSAPIQIDLDIAFGGPQRRAIEVMADVVDCGIDICAPEILVEFRDNFDFSEIRDFIREKLDSGEAEILGNKVCARFLDSQAGEYATQIVDLDSYAMASADIVNRWAFPFTPDASLMPSARYQFQRGRGYRERSAYISKSAVIEEGCVIGPRVQIGESARILRSVLGEDVVVGEGAVIVDSQLWRETRVGSQTEVRHAVLCHGSVVGSHCVIEDGCLLGSGTGVGDQVVLPRGTWLSLGELDEDYDGESSDGAEYEVSATQHSLSGKVTGRVVYCPWQDSSLFNDFPVDCVESDLEAESTPSESDPIEPHSDQDLEPEGLDSESRVYDATTAFMSEVKETVARALAEKVLVSNVILEINGLKLAYDRSYGDCARTILRCFLSVASTMTHNAPELLDLVQSWKEALTKFVTSGAEQLELLNGLAMASKDSDLVCQVLPSLLEFFYDLDVTEEEIIWKWESTIEDQVRHAAAPFLTWLKTAEEDDDEDEDEDEG